MCSPQKTGEDKSADREDNINIVASIIGNFNSFIKNKSNIKVTGYISSICLYDCTKISLYLVYDY